MKRIINGICVIAGTFAFVIGTIGIVLPILPTVPFYLLTAALYARGSEKFHRWFLSSGLYKKYIEDVFRKKELTKQKKMKVLMTLMLLFTIGFLVSPIWHAKALIAIVAIGHLYYFLFKIKTTPKEEEYVS